MDLSVFGVEVTDLAYDARAVTPGALFFCIPGQTADGHDFAAEAVERGAVALVVERRLDDLDVPQLDRPERARRDGAGRRRLLRPAVRHARGRRGDRDEREDDDGIPAARDPRRSRSAARAAHEHPPRRRRRGAADRPQHARGDRPAAPVPRDARRRRPLVRDGGDVDRRRARSSCRHALRACSSSRT